jgi:hypothetical protein
MADKREGAGGKTVAAYEAEAQALRAKTARLRELRLAHEAATGVISSASSPTKRTVKRAAPKAKAGKSKGSSQTLSEWLTIQENQGRRS